MNLFDALKAADFEKAGITTFRGKVVEYIFFNANGICVNVQYQYAKPEFQPDAPENF